eukprot:1885403-Heterocapsa_arctica.AAC.1
MSPIGLAHGIDWQFRKVAVVQQPSTTVGSADVNIVDKAILDHLLTGDNAVMGDGHAVSLNELS